MLFVIVLRNKIIEINLPNWKIRADCMASKEDWHVIHSSKMEAENQGKKSCNRLLLYLVVKRKLFLFFPYVARLSLCFVQFSLYLQITRQLDNFKRQYWNETRRSPISIGVLRFSFSNLSFLWSFVWLGCEYSCFRLAYAYNWIVHFLMCWNSEASGMFRTYQLIIS